MFCYMEGKGVTTEKVDLYKRERYRIGRVVERGKQRARDGARMVVKLCIFNSKGEMLIQQRSDNKTGGGLWDISVAGGVQAGESSWEAINREAKEELGLQLELEQHFPNITVDFKNGFTEIYLVEQDVSLGSLVLNLEEVQAVKWASLEEILVRRDTGRFLKYHKGLLQSMFEMRMYLGELEQE